MTENPSAKLMPLLATVLVGVAIWFIPPPEGVDIKAWQLLAIFVATIVGIVAKPLPMGAVAVLGVMATALTGTLTIRESLSGFGNSVICSSLSLSSSLGALSKQVWGSDRLSVHGHGGQEDSRSGLWTRGHGLGAGPGHPQ